MSWSDTWLLRPSRLMIRLCGGSRMQPCTPACLEWHLIILLFQVSLVSFLSAFELTPSLATLNESFHVAVSSSHTSAIVLVLKVHALSSVLALRAFLDSFKMPIFLMSPSYLRNRLTLSSRQRSGRLFFHILMMRIFMMIVLMSIMIDNSVLMYPTREYMCLNEI
jgi:hypothetical protein